MEGRFLNPDALLPSSLRYRSDLMRHPWGIMRRHSDRRAPEAWAARCLKSTRSGRPAPSVGGATRHTHAHPASGIGRATMILKGERVGTTSVRSKPPFLRSA